MKQLSDAEDLKAREYSRRISLHSENYNKRTDSSKVVQNNQVEIIQGLVSVIMPVYNTPNECLVASINSVLGQTYSDFELLIVDDGSQMECARTCDYFERDGRVKVFHINNSGVSVARNYGIEKAKGEYIAFIDSDDTMEDDAIKTMVQEISGFDFVTMGCRHVTEITKKEKTINEGCAVANQRECIDYLCYMNPPYDHIETTAIWGKLYRKTIIGSLRFDENVMMAEDFKFNYEYLLKISNGKYLNYIGYNYLEREGSISRTYKPEMMRTIAVIEKMSTEYRNEYVYDALISRCVNIAFTILMMIPRKMRSERKKVEHFISLHRYRVMRNHLSKKKVRVACLTSYLGYGMTQVLFEIGRR